MNMSADIPKSTGALIAQLVDGLEPVRPLRFSSGLGFVLAGLGVTMTTVALLFGIRSDVATGSFDPVFLLSTGLFLMLGLASAITVVVMSRPRVGSHYDGLGWAAATASLLPVSAAIFGFGSGPIAFSAETLGHGLECLASGSAFSVLIFAVLIWWLRLGAPTSPERAGLLVGVAAGSLGIFAFSFHCVYSDIIHIGYWHSAVVVVSAAIGRVTVPKLICW